jgi:hypothetical protein
MNKVGFISKICPKYCYFDHHKALCVQFYQAIELESEYYNSLELTLWKSKSNFIDMIM